MLDINGIELQVGDDVVYTNRNLNDLEKGKIFKITKSKAVIKYREDYHYDNGKTGADHYKHTTRYHHNIMNPQQVMKL